MALKWTPALAAYFGLTALASPLMLSRSQRNIAPNRHSERSGIPTIPIKAGLTWVSAASVGELRAVLPLLPALGPTLLTTQTATAADLAETQGLLHQFTPIDTPAATTSFLRNWQPRAAVFVESEVPPRMITRLASQGIPTALIGARASKTRAKAPKSMANILSQLAVITASTPAVTDELTSLGLSVTATEDLKAALPTEPVPQAKLNKWTEVQQRPIWLAASTHPGDETVVLKAHQQVLEHQ
ncbi:MAG: glycosyltransferase N-terminal domain-containing protein, partial [Pseudomonadota bacterium]